MVYDYPDGREAAFDIHTSWVTPDNFPGYVEQEVQFRFDNGVWNAHQRKRGVEVTVEGRTPRELKNTPNHHYNGTFLEPWGERIAARLRHRGHPTLLRGGGVSSSSAARRSAAQSRSTRCARFATTTSPPTGNVVAAVQAMEAILAHARRRARPDCVVA